MYHNNNMYFLYTCIFSLYSVHDITYVDTGMILSIFYKIDLTLLQDILDHVCHLLHDNSIVRM